MTVEIFDVEQGTPDWWAAKLGVPSASNFSAVLAGGDGKTRSLYMRKLAGEIVWGYQREDYRNADMDRGNAMEPHLRATYALMKNVEPKLVGFVKRQIKVGFAGYSPDAFVGDDGLLEVKSAAPHVLIEIMRTNRIPPEHAPQAQGGMLVTGRAWCDVIIGFEAAPGYPGAEPAVFRARRDTGYIARLELALETFNAELVQMVEWVRRWGKKT